MQHNLKKSIEKKRVFFITKHIYFLIILEWKKLLLQLVYYFELYC